MEFDGPLVVGMCCSPAAARRVTGDVSQPVIVGTSERPSERELELIGGQLGHHEAVALLEPLGATFPGTTTDSNDLGSISVQVYSQGIGRARLSRVVEECGRALVTAVRPVLQHQWRLAGHRALRNDAGVRAYKFLKRDRTAPFTGFQWPTGEWVVADGPLAWCINGIHACRIADLPHWIGQELWLMELAGETLAAADSLVAQRARLVEHIEAWSDGAAQEFGDSCAQRAISLAAEAPSTAERAGDAVTAAANGLVAGSAYIAAAVAGEVAGGARTGPRYERGFLSERSRQARWIKDRLTLAEG